ncbi:MAG: sulfotransferase family protein [Carbonactinosporaceae bacterium]
MQRTTAESATPPVGRSSPFAGLSDRPVFVGACPRSGTTLLRTMLNSHPELAVPHETRFVVDVWQRRAQFGDLSDPKNRRRLARWIIKRPKSRVHRLDAEPKEIVARLVAAPPTLGSLLGTCFALYAERHGKPRWGDKRPSYAQHLDAVFAMFPDAQYINIVRDPRAAVASIRKIGWFNGDVVPAADVWERAVRSVDSWRKRLAPDQLLEIQYEDLVADPQSVVDRIVGFLGLPPEGIEAMLSFHENSDIPRSGRFHPLVSTPVTTSALRTWEESLSREEIAFVEGALAGKMQRYGYEPVAADVRVPDEMRRNFKRRQRHKAKERVSGTVDDAKLRFTYRQPVAARLTSGQCR